MSELTPYDTGERLEPHVWVRGQTASPGGRPRRATQSDYGRVDFDTDDGTTALTLYVAPAKHGYMVHADQHDDEYLQLAAINELPVIDGPTTELDPAYRERQAMLLEAGLREVADTYSEHVYYLEDGDTDAFSPGNHLFVPAGPNDGTWFAIEDIYERPHAYMDDPDSVLIGWAWHESGLQRLPDGTTRATRVAEGTTIVSDIDRLIARARDFAATVSEHAEAVEINHSLDRAQMYRGDWPTR